MKIELHTLNVHMSPHEWDEELMEYSWILTLRFGNTPIKDWAIEPTYFADDDQVQEFANDFIAEKIAKLFE